MSSPYFYVKQTKKFVPRQGPETPTLSPQERFHAKREEQEFKKMFPGKSPTSKSKGGK